MLLFSPVCCAPRKISVRRALALAIASLAAACIGGCANPGPPRPPTLNLPATVTDLTASRIGERVELHWTTPTRTTDGLDLTRPTTSQICRDASPYPDPNPPVPPQPRPCAPILQLPSQPGEMRASLQLPLDLSAPGAPPVLAYRVIVSNTTGRSAGPSPPAAVPGGPTIPPLMNFRARQIKSGVLLEWAEPKAPALSSVIHTEDVVELLRTVDPSSTNPINPAGSTRAAALSSPAKGSSPAKSAGLRGAIGGLAATRKKLDETQQELHLRADSTQSSTIPGHLLDVTPSMGRTYLYRAQRVRTALLQGKPVESRSEPTPPVAVALQDTFPPDTPTGLVSVPATSPGSSAPALDLSWQPNTDPKLSGYFIYRADLSPAQTTQPAERRLNSSAIPGPAYHDATVLAGHRYRYRITAVDQAGNESQPSTPVVDTP